MHNYKLNSHNINHPVSLIEDAAPIPAHIHAVKNVCVTCINDVAIEGVYDLLTNPARGEGVLSGSITCVNKHDAIPNIMEFSLTNEQIEAVKKIEGVARVSDSIIPRRHRFTKIDSNITPAIAQSSYNTTTNVAPHSIYYGQESKLSFIDQSDILGRSVSLSSIDCSNVDVIIWDSGVDASHADLTNTVTGSALVVQFDWSQLTDDTNFPIVEAVPSNYYTDKEGHGTACASLVAGKRCGFAKNAKIYSIKDQDFVGRNDNGFTYTQCLQLVLAFLNATS